LAEVGQEPAVEQEGWPATQPAEAQTPAEPGPAAEPEPTAEPPLEPTAAIRVARTMVLSEPEAEQLIASEPRLLADGVEVKLEEKGFGTRITVIAAPVSGLEQADLAELLERLAEPRKRPFSNA